MRINLDQKTMDMEQRDINYILPAYIRNYLFQSKNEDPLEIVFPMFSSVPHPTKRGVTVPIRYVPEISPEAMEISVDGATVAEATEEEIAVKDEVDDMRKEAKAEIGNVYVEPKPEPNPEPSDVCPPHWWNDGGQCNICGAEKEVSPAPEDLIRQQEETISQLEDDTADLQLEVDTTPEEVSPARAAFAEVATEEPTPTTREIKGPPSGPILPPGTPLDNMAPRDRGDQTRVAKDLRPEPDVDESKEVEAVIEKPEEV